ncbi:hypothetical protein MMC13_002597 [Lambiella insularis]|nr:hypothetical protein [Lambiella insularis]
MRSYELKGVPETQVSEAGPSDSEGIGIGPHGAPKVVGNNEIPAYGGVPVAAIAEVETRKKGRFAYFKTKDFYIVLVLGYTTILSAELINFWAISVVVIVSFLFLKVRYHPAQIIGIFICIGGLGILIGSDHITGTNQYSVSSGDQLKGDLFALLGATFYGFSNIAEEFLASERPLYEVVGQLGFWGMIINGVQAGIFDRGSFQSATWDGPIGGYIAGYTLALTIFYSLAPIIFRMSSAAFFNISLLTSNFWGAIIGIQVFGLTVYYLYPIAFVCIVGGLIVYFVGKQVYGEALKPWLGRNQEKGISGIGTAKRRAEHPDAIV